MDDYESEILINNLENKNKDISLKEDFSIGNVFFDSNPQNIEFSDYIIESYAHEALDNTFLLFESINNILYLVYSNLDNSIISYNLIDNKKIIEIKNSNYWSYITNFRHYPDKKNKRDLIISISYENNLKLWNVNNWENLLNISYINKIGYLYSACFLNDNNQIFIITSNFYLDNDSEHIKVFDLNGKLIKYINYSYNDNTYFIDSYYDKIIHNNYIIACNQDYVISYDFNKNNIYHKYYDKNFKEHSSLIIKFTEKETELIESCEDGNLRIWNFHTGNLIKMIKIYNGSLYGICLWNKECIFVCCKDKTIKLVNLNSGKILNNLIGHNTRVLSIKKIIHPKYGECLFSQGYGFNKIMLWRTKL